MKILMVCLGNICRSPLAEGILQQKAFDAGLRWSVESAGTISQTGNSPHYLSQKIARLHKVDISGQRARRFVKEDMLRFDKIYAMSSDVLQDITRIAKENQNHQKVDLLLNELYPGLDRSIPDPWSGPEKEYQEVYEMIDAACSAIVKKYSLINVQ